MMKYKRMILFLVIVIISAAGIVAANIDLFISEANEPIQLEYLRIKAIEEHKALILEEFAQIYGVSVNELEKLTNEKGSMNEALCYLIEQNYRFDEETARNLYDQGFSLNDISKAEELAIQSDYRPIEIIMQKNDANTWDDVISIMAIDTRPLAIKKGMPEEMFHDLTKKGLTNSDISQIALMSINYKKDMGEVAMMVLEKGEKAVNAELSRREESQDNTAKAIDQLLERTIVQIFNLSDEDYQMIKEKGITGSEISFVLRLAKSNDIPLEVLLTNKDDESTWHEALERIREVNENEKD